jgi:hypothetical protein
VATTDCSAEIPGWIKYNSFNTLKGWTMQDIIPQSDVCGIVNTKEILPFVKLSSSKEKETRCGVKVKASVCATTISVLDAIVVRITVDLSFMKLVFYTSAPLTDYCYYTIVFMHVDLCCEN